jgi:hypothetical protein
MAVCWDNESESILFLISSLADAHTFNKSQIYPDQCSLPIWRAAIVGTETNRDTTPHPKMRTSELAL